MKNFGYDVAPYTPYKIRSDFISFPQSTLKKMSIGDLRKMAINLTDLWVETGESGSLFENQLSLCDSVDKNSFTSHDPSDSLDGHSSFFEQNYRYIMCNENPDWILYGIDIWYDRVKLKYCDYTTGVDVIRSEYNGTVYIRQGNLPKKIHFIANVPSIDGNENESYEILFCYDDWRLSDGSYGSYFSIQESTGRVSKKGRRLRFFFENGKYICRIDE